MPLNTKRAAFNAGLRDNPIYTTKLYLWINQFDLLMLLTFLVIILLTVIDRFTLVRNLLLAIDAAAAILRNGLLIWEIWYRAKHKFNDLN